MDAVDSFVEKHLRLLELERDAEIEENVEHLQEKSSKILQHRGLLLQRLRLSSHRSGLYGRCVCTFQPQFKTSFPSHRITSGDIVGVCEANGGALEVLCSGVVLQTSSTHLKVALEGLWEQLSLRDEHTYSLLKLANDVTYKRLKGALHLLQKPDVKQSSLVEVLFNFRTPQSNDAQPELITEDFVNPDLNEEQKQAVNFALRQKEVAVIHGPPGTGKTTTLIEIIQQAVRKKEKVLVCAPSNIAVDNLVERLAGPDPKGKRLQLVRLGHPARVMPLILHHTLDAMMARSHQAPLLDDIRREIDQISRQGIERPLRPGEVHQRRALQTELVDRERSAESELLRGVDVVLCTLTSASHQGPLKHLPDNHFALTVIDECSQGLESACWICLPRAPKVVIAGDHLQLPPTIISNHASQEGLSVSLMERLCALCPEVSRMLCMQYRMHTDIMSWASRQLYQEKLIAHQSVSKHTLCDLADVESNDETSSVLLLIDTAGCQFWETDLGEDQSKGNSGEADLVSIHVSRLIQSGLDPNHIAVVTPYNLQVEFLRRRLSDRFPSLEIQSVDGFQGREKEAVVLSLVRSNDKGEVGFLSEKRRINVAVTRARRHLAVVCDSETVNRDAFLQSLVEHLSSHGEVRSAHQYTNELGSLEPCLDVPSSGQQRSACEPKVTKKSTTAKHAQNKSCNNQNNTAFYRNGDKPVRRSEEERSAEFEKELQAFASNPDLESCSFSSELNSFERRIIHMLCEKLGLVHISKDDDNKRFIQVYKKYSKSFDYSIPPQDLNTVSKDLKNSLTVSKPIQPKTEVPSCKQESPKIEETSHDDAQPTAQPKSARNTKSKVKKQPKKICPEETEDFEMLVAAAVNSDNRCSQGGCATSTTLLGQACGLCNKRWCLKHSLPEVHGCGEAAKMEARRKARQGAAPPKVDPNKRAHLHRALEKGLTQMQRKRKGQAK